MFFDKQTLFSDRQSVSATTDAAFTVDLGKGDSGPADIALYVGASDYSGSGGLTVELFTAAETDASGALANPVKIAAWPVDNAALLAGGKIVAARLPHGMKRYATLKYNVSGTISGGRINAGLVIDA